jgi:hypothetical protein
MLSCALLHRSVDDLLVIDEGCVSAFHECVAWARAFARGCMCPSTLIDVEWP